MDKQYYTYLWKDPKTNVPIYVGKGQQKRAWDHLRAHSKLGCTLRKRIREGFNLQPIIHYEADEQQAYFMEKVWIMLHGRADLGEGTLFNKSEGGNAPPSPKGRKQSVETKARRAITVSKPEFKAMMAPIRKEAANRPDVKAKVDEARKRAWADPVSREKRVASITKVRNTPESKAKTSAISIKISLQPDTIAKRKESQKAAWAKPGAKETRSATQKEVQNKPEVNTKRSNSLKTTLAIPEIKAKLIYVQSKPLMTPKGVFLNVKEACKEFGVANETIRYRANNEHPGYYYITKEEYDRLKK